jgi:hypothetical protein
MDTACAGHAKITRHAVSHAEKNFIGAQLARAPPLFQGKWQMDIITLILIIILIVITIIILFVRGLTLGRNLVVAKLDFPGRLCHQGRTMIRQISSFGKLLPLTAAALFLTAATVSAQDTPAASSPAAQTQPAETAANSLKTFDAVADEALAAMQKLATERNVKGVAVVSISEGDSVQSWTSKMLVVGNLKSAPSANDPVGANLLAIAYSKSAEMADTLKASGSKVRPPIKGEFGWEGGVIAKGRTGYLIVAFSGGSSADDLKISQAGLTVLSGSL